MKTLFDNKMLANNRIRALFQPEDTMFLRQASITRLLDRLYDVNRNFSSILDIGCFNGQLAKQLLSMSPAKHTENFTLHQIDLSRKMGIFAHAKAKFTHSPEMKIPQEMDFFDLILSSQYFQWVNDLPGMLTQCRNKLKPDGLLLANFFGGRTLQELRACLTQAEMELSKGAYTRCIPMVDIKAAGGLLQRAGFALPVCDSDIIEVLYPSIFELMLDLRRMGEANALVSRSRQFTSKKLFQRAGQIYQQQFSNDDKSIIATFELVTLTGWVPDESQQKPMRPGSARNSLLEYLKSDMNKEG